MKKYDGARTRKFNSRKRKLGEMKPNSEVPTFKIKLKKNKKKKQLNQVMNSN